MNAAPERVPALVFGEAVTLLGTLRSLGAAKIPILVGSDPHDYTRRSRHFRRAPGAPLRTGSTAELAEDLRRLTVARAVLVPCADSAAVAVAGLPDDLRERFPASCPSAEVQATLADKLRFARVLRELDVPHPRTIEIDSRETVAGLSDEELGRFFLKPLDSERFSKHYGVKACLPNGRQEAVEKLDHLMEDGHPVVLQEYIGGPPDRHFFIDGFVDRHGTVRARFARRRLRMYPPLLGNSSAMVSMPLDEVADSCAALERLLAGLSFRGIFSAEFKRDPRDGVGKLLEVNARPWWYIGFALACGVNVAEMAYADALGREVAPVTAYRTGRHGVYPVQDVKAGLIEIRAGRLSAWRFVASWWRHVDPIFSWRDPGPGFAEFFRLVPHMARKLVSSEEA